MIACLGEKREVGEGWIEEDGKVAFQNCHPFISSMSSAVNFVAIQYGGIQSFNNLHKYAQNQNFFKICRLFNQTLVSLKAEAKHEPFKISFHAIPDAT